MELIKQITACISNLGDSYLGKYKSSNKEFNEIRLDLKNINFSSMKDDAENLKKDRKNFLNDFNRAFKKKCINTNIKL